MLLLKSLICLKGHDNGRRFLVICAICYFLLLLVLPVLAKAGILVALLFLIVTPIILASSIRRVQDAHFATPLASIPVIVYWINLFGLTYLQHGSKWTLLVVGIISSVAVAALNNVRMRKDAYYRLGYNGPVEFKAETEEVTSSERIEPTLTGQAHASQNSPAHNQPEKSYPEDNHNDYRNDYRHSDTHPSQSNQPSVWERKLNLWFNENKKLSFGAIGILSILVIGVLVISSFDSTTDEQQVIEETKSTDFVKERLNKIAMPDQFWIMLDQNDSLTIAWEGDPKNESDLGPEKSYWSASTGKGDNDCVSLDFSLGEKLRSLNVTVKNGGDYYADFSPVDTAVIVKSIADKDRFKLCGYEFTLRGTRALLRKNDKFREYIQ